MSNEIKAALHVAMEAIDAKLRHTGLKPGHENDLRAAKGFLRSMISNLPAASGQQEGIEAAFENAMKTGTGFLRIEAIDPADVFHPAPAQQESEKPYGWVNAGTERQQTIYATLNVGPENPWVETANAFPVYTRAPAPAALTDEQIVEAVRAAKVLCVHPDASTTIDIGRAVLKAAIASQQKGSQV